MNAPRIIDQEQPGFYQLRLVKNGAYVAARIFRECHCTVNGGADCAAHDWCESCDRFPPLRAEIDGEDAEPQRVWISGRPIPEAEYRFLIADAAHCRAHLPSDPKANPRKAVDFHSMPLPF